MSERNPFDPGPKTPRGRTLECEEWEALLVDALDGTLGAADHAAFRLHSESCGACGELLEQAKRGQEWLRFLHEEPPVPADLMAKILTSTSGAAATGQLQTAGAPMPIPVHTVPFWKRITVPPGMRRMADTRLMMTAAMAFFSIALTLNLAGVRVSAMHLADLRPATMRANLSRQFYHANARVAQYYNGLRIVYEVEARVRELRRDAQTDETPKPKSEQPSTNAKPDGSAKKNGGKSETPKIAEPRPMVRGEAVRASLENTREAGSPAVQGEQLLASADSKSAVGPLVCLPEDQAERSLA
jgi:hypothetical protein